MAELGLNEAYQNMVTNLNKLKDLKEEALATEKSLNDDVEKMSDSKKNWEAKVKYFSEKLLAKKKKENEYLEKVATVKSTLDAKLEESNKAYWEKMSSTLQDAEGLVVRLMADLDTRMEVQQTIKLNEAYQNMVTNISTLKDLKEKAIDTEKKRNEYIEKVGDWKKEYDANLKVVVETVAGIKKQGNDALQKMVTLKNKGEAELEQLSEAYQNRMAISLQEAEGLVVQLGAELYNSRMQMMQVQGLQGQFEWHRSKLALTEAQLGEAEHLVVELRAQLESSRMEAQGLQGQLESSRMEAQGLQGQLESSRMQVRTLESQLAVSDNEVRAMESDLVSSRKEVEVLNTQLEALRKGEQVILVLHL